MFGIGGTELFIIFVFGLLVFGPDRLPQFGRTIGRAMRQFQRAQDDMTRIIKAEMYTADTDKDSSPFKPVESILDRKPTAPKESEGETAGPVEAPTGSIAASLYDLEPESADEREEEGE